MCASTASPTTEVVTEDDTMAQLYPELTIDRWRTGEVGWPPRSEAVELLWLPLLGPTSLALLRRLDALTEQGAALVGLEDLGASLGLRSRETGVRAVVRAVERLVTFELARLPGPDRLEVRDPVPLLTARQRRALPRSLQGVDAHRPDASALAAAQRREARLVQLAATLLGLGASEAEATARVVRQGHSTEAVARALNEARRRAAPRRATARA